MKLVFLFLLISHQVKALDFWQNPPVICPEEIMPKGLECPDFSKVSNVYTDFPYDFSVDDINEWKMNRSADLRNCRNKEVLRRELINPGTYGAVAVEIAWMNVSGGEHALEKLAEIKKAADSFDIPEQILIGAMRQESLLATLGISSDGGNYSCGMSQLNLQEWCRGISRLTVDDQAKYGWPAGMDCDEASLPLDLVKPFYAIAIKNLGTKAHYLLDSSHFNSIQFDDVLKDFPAGGKMLQQKRFEAVKSFINNCQSINLSISFKAHTLRELFDKYVPESLKFSEIYKDNEAYNRKCLSPYSTKYYPLHTGWLLAVAMYNAGPMQSKILEHYHQTDSTHLPELNPKDLIEALHWGGKWKKNTTLIEFKDGQQNKYTQKWYKSCVVQRHVARVIQHVTLPSMSIAKSLEQAPCSPSAEVPDYRKKSSGIKE